MKNILVGIDFYEKTEHLISKAIELAKPYHGKIWLLHVAAPNPEFVGYEVGPQYIRDGRAEELKKEHKLLLEYTRQLNTKGIEAEGLLIQGATIEMILKESKKLHIDMIIVGYHDHSFLYNAFFGNTALKVGCSVCQLCDAPLFSSLSIRFRSP